MINFVHHSANSIQAIVVVLQLILYIISRNIETLVGPWGFRNCQELAGLPVRQEGDTSYDEASLVWARGSAWACSWSLELLCKRKWS